MTLKEQIERLAATFAEGVLEALREASVEDLLGEGAPRVGNGATRSGRRRDAAPQPTGNGRSAPRPKAPVSEVQHVVGLLVAHLREHRMGLRSEQIQRALNLSRRELSAPLAAALADERIVKTGERRATVYFAR